MQYKLFMAKKVQVYTYSLTKRFAAFICNYMIFEYALHVVFVCLKKRRRKKILVQGRLISACQLFRCVI